MNYTSRDVQSNIKDLVEDVRVETHVWQPGSEADPGMILLKALAANVDLLSFNLDTQVSEMYMQSATQIKSIRRLGVANGYTPRWYRAARTTVCFQNTSDEEVELDFSLPLRRSKSDNKDRNNDLFASQNALEDLTSIPYYVIPKAGPGGIDRPTIQPAGTEDYLGPQDRIYREAAQGILRSIIINPSMLDVDASYINSLVTRLPSQNVDSDLIWVVEVSATLDPTEVLWKYDAGSGLIGGSIKEPRYQITTDDYNNLVILFNASINDTIQRGNLIQIFYLETYGVVGEIAPNVLSFSSKDSALNDSLKLMHPGNTMDIADGSALTGLAPQTAHEAALDAVNWVNTNDSIITLKNYDAWIRRQPGVSAGVSVDCQKALELNLALYYNENIEDDTLRQCKYIRSGWYETTEGDRSILVDTTSEGFGDFPSNIDANGRKWDPLADADLPLPEDCRNFLVYKLLFFCVYNNFLKEYDTGYRYENGDKEILPCAEWVGDPTAERPYRRYRPSVYIRKMLQRNYRPTYNLTCSIDFGFVRVFEWCANGVIYTKKPVTKSEAESLVELAMIALKVRFNAVNLEMGRIPRLVEVVECVQSCDDRIQYFDAGLLNKPMIEWCPVRDADGRVPDSSLLCNPDYFNYISFARFIDGGDDVPAGTVYSKISVAKECILEVTNR